MTNAAEITRTIVSAVKWIIRVDKNTPPNGVKINRWQHLNIPQCQLLRCWLGREDSNLRMAESKTEHFSFLVKGHSEKTAKFGPNSINNLGRSSECRSGGRTLH